MVMVMKKRDGVWANSRIICMNPSRRLLNSGYRLLRVRLGLGFRLQNIMTSRFASCKAYPNAIKGGFLIGRVLMLVWCIASGHFLFG